MRGGAVFVQRAWRMLVGAAAMIPEHSRIEYGASIGTGIDDASGVVTHAIRSLAITAASVPAPLSVGGTASNRWRAEIVRITRFLCPNSSARSK